MKSSNSTPVTLPSFLESHSLKYDSMSLSVSSLLRESITVLSSSKFKAPLPSLSYL